MNRAQVIDAVKERVEAIQTAIQKAPVPRIDSIDLATYPGPLRLHCSACGEERLTMVRFEPPKVRVEGTVMHVEAEGIRECVECRSNRVGLKFITVTVQVSDPEAT